MGNAACKAALLRSPDQHPEATYASFGLLVSVFVLTGIGFGVRLVQVNPLHAAAPACGAHTPSLQWLLLSRASRDELWRRYVNP